MRSLSSQHKEDRRTESRTDSPLTREHNASGASLGGRGIKSGELTVEANIVQQFELDIMIDNITPEPRCNRTTRGRLRARHTAYTFWRGA